MSAKLKDLSEAINAVCCRRSLNEFTGWKLASHELLRAIGGDFVARPAVLDHAVVQSIASFGCNAGPALRI